MKNLIAFLLKRLKSPVVLAMTLGLLVVILLPPLIAPHSASLISSELPSNYLAAYYSEPSDNDTLDYSVFLSTGQSSKILKPNKFLSIPKYSSASYKDIYNAFLPPSKHSIYYADLDADGHSECAFLSCDNDSNMLYVADAKAMTISYSIYLPVAGRVYDYNTRWFQRSGDPLLYLSLVTLLPHSRSLTTLFSYDYASNKIIQLHQIERWANSYMFDSYRDDILFLQTVSLDKHLFSKYNLDSGKVDTFSYKRPRRTCVLSPSFNLQMMPSDKKDDFLFLSDSNKHLNFVNLDSLFLSQKVVAKSIPHEEEAGRMELLYSKGGVIFFTVRNGEECYSLWKYDCTTDRSTMVKQTVDARVHNLIFYGDMDNNGVNEIVYTDGDFDKVAICVQEEGGRHDVLRFLIPQNPSFFVNVVFVNQELRFYSKGVGHRLVNYQINANYYKRWYIYGATMVLFWLFGFVIEQVRENRKLRQEETNNKILQLQLENIQKRIDPHFIFNSLNNLGSLILEGESNNSYDYLSKVSGVLYKALRNRSVLISVEEEVSFCTSVLDAQGQRFKNKFSYEVFIDHQVGLQQKMPSNILNLMVDNCIKHGFSGIDYLGVINIDILHKDKGFLVVIEDNGKGVKAAYADNDQTKSTGTGLEVCNQYVKLLNHKRKSNLLSFRIVDLYHDNGSPQGTRCEFYVPENLV